MGPDRIFLMPVILGKGDRFVRGCPGNMNLGTPAAMPLHRHTTTRESPVNVAESIAEARARRRCLDVELVSDLCVADTK